MAIRQPDRLPWERTEPGRYDATGRDGDHWHVVQSASRRWDVYRNGNLFTDAAVTMADARWYAEQEDDPVARETRDRHRREREQRRAARAAS